MRGLAGRIGDFRVAAALVGVALLLNVIATQAFASGSTGRVACTVAQVPFLVAAVVFFLSGLRERRDRAGSRAR